MTAIVAPLSASFAAGVAGPMARRAGGPARPRAATAGRAVALVAAGLVLGFAALAGASGAAHAGAVAAAGAGPSTGAIAGGPAGAAAAGSLTPAYAPGAPAGQWASSAPAATSSLPGIGAALPAFDAFDVTWKALLVIGLLLITLRFLRRGVAAAPARARLTVLETRSVAPKAQLLIVAVGPRRLLVGLTPGGMTTLADLDAAALDEPAAAELLHPVTRRAGRAPGAPGGALLDLISAGLGSLLPAGRAAAWRDRLGRLARLGR